jgi:antagonist of KipI
VTIIEVLDGGMLTTVQDLGRFGYQRFGVPVSGALDLFSLRAANRLVGNPDDAAGLEMTLIGPRLRFVAPVTLALAGADLGARLDGPSTHSGPIRASSRDGLPVPRWESVVAGPGATLTFTGARDGVRGYLAVAGGVDVPRVLGSRATYTRSRLGGVDGRALRSGDTLGIEGPRPVVLGGALQLPEARRAVYGHTHRLRVVLGPQDDRFTDEGLHTFLSATYTVSPQSDRMGCRLAGPPIQHTRGADIVSDGTPFGGVQVAGDGVPIVLLADRGTAGGYTKIATVIGPDIPSLAQAAAGDRVTFESISLADAYEAVRREEADLATIGPARRARPDAGRLTKVAAVVAAIASIE